MKLGHVNGECERSELLTTLSNYHTALDCLILGGFFLEKNSLCSCVVIIGSLFYVSAPNPNGDKTAN